MDFLQTILDNPDTLVDIPSKSIDPLPKRHTGEL